MAKIYCGFLCILLLCNCHHNRVPENGIELKEEAVLDVPVQVDTTFADTARVPKTDTLVIIDTPKNSNSDIVIVEKMASPSLDQVYQSYLGVREKSGRNDGPEVEKFLKNVGLGPGYPWCAAFVKTCLLEAGIKSASRINGMALSTENKSHFIYRARKHLGEPEPGDVFTIWYSSLGRIGHTGFFHKKINSSFFETVEGNTNDAGSREGDGVYRKKRSYNATYSISRWK